MLVDLLLAVHAFDLGAQIVVLGCVLGFLILVVSLAGLKFKVDAVHLNVHSKLVYRNMEVGSQFHLATVGASNNGHILNTVAHGGIVPALDVSSVVHVIVLLGKRGARDETTA